MYTRNKLRSQYSNYVKTDSIKGLPDPVDFTFNEFIIRVATSACEYCDRHSNLGLDRIDNSKGHSLSNTVVCCNECNTIKGSKSVEEMLAKDTLLRCRISSAMEKHIIDKCMERNISVSNYIRGLIYNDINRQLVIDDLSPESLRVLGITQSELVCMDMICYNEGISYIDIVNRGLRSEFMKFVQK